MLDSDFLAELKRATEARWSSELLDRKIYGFQFQPGTRWISGLSEKAIQEYEAAIAIRFPTDFRKFLRAMNGTDLPTVNLYGNCGVPLRESVGVYSFPRDLKLIKELIQAVDLIRDEMITTLADQGYRIDSEARFTPIYAHRYLVCTSDPESSTVLSIFDGKDTIVYAGSLEEYIAKEFMKQTS